MNEKKKIACFFTVGYTELYAMKLFMKKINNDAEYIQLCPIRERRSKKSIKDRRTGGICSDQNGMTGKQLINHVLSFIERKEFQAEEYDAILIEDDKDDWFLSEQPDGSSKIDDAGWATFKEDVTREIKNKYPNMPVIFIYAAPEVEAWFLADWDNSFGSVYIDKFTGQQNLHFSTKFRRYVNKFILTDRYKECIEEYGYFDGAYRKLSDQIKNALDVTDFLEDYRSEMEHPTVRYSKKDQGMIMLEQIDPQAVLQKCTFFFKEGYWQLKAL